MPGPLFKEEQLRLCVVAALFSGTSIVAEALLLPPKPLKSSASWDCRTGHSNDWLCQNSSPVSYSASRQIPQPEPKPAPETSRQMALPVFRPEPALPEREVPAGLPVSDASEAALLMELLNSPDNHYVLQWLAANDRTPLEQLKQRYPVLQDATIAHYKRSGKDWYVLLDGPYSNRIAAMAALESSPRAQMSRELYPWTRSLASIQRLDLIRPNQNNEQLAKQYTSDSSSYKGREIPAAQPSIANFVYPEKSVQSYDIIQPAIQQALPSEQTMAYGQEFENNYYSYPSAISDQPPQEMYASIEPAYRSRVREQTTGEVDYNQPIQKPVAQQDYNDYEPSEEAVTGETVTGYLPSEDVLNAKPDNYTIEWMSSNHRAALERAQRRYEEFRDTQILQYQRYNRNRYVLVSKIFGNRRDAVGALSRPSLSRVSARLTPRIRQIGYLQKLVDHSPRGYRRTAEIQRAQSQQPVPRYRQPVRRTAPVKSQPVKGTILRYAKSPTPDAHPDQLAFATPGKGYTIQWFAANNAESVEKMKRRFPELAKAETVHFRRNNRDWYVLLQGRYRNSHEAVTAIKNPALKQAMLVLHPWTRPVNSLKKLQIVSR